MQRTDQWINKIQTFKVIDNAERRGLTQLRKSARKIQNIRSYLLFCDRIVVDGENMYNSMAVSNPLWHG